MTNRPAPAKGRSARRPRPSSAGCRRRFRPAPERSPGRDAHRVGRAHPHGRRDRPAGRRVPPARARQGPGHPVLRAVRQGPRLRGPLHRPVAPDGRGLSRGDGQLDQQVPELGGRGPREVGAGRLRVRPGRLPRRRPLAGCPRHLVAPGDAGLSRLHRVGGGAALVQRQGRPERHLVLRDEPVAGGVAPAPAPGRHLHLGGGRRLLPRSQPPRRDPLLLRPRVVPLAGHHPPARPRHPRAPQPHERRLDLRAGDADGGGAGRAPPGLLRGLPREPPRHRRVLALPHARLLPHHGADADRGQLGRPGPPSARQLRGLHARGLAGEVARGPRGRALDALLHQLRPGPPEALLRPLPEGRGHRLGEAAEGRAAGPAPGRAVRRAPRERVALDRHPLDEALSPSGRPDAGRRAAEPRVDGHVRRPRRRRHVPHPAARRGDGDHRADRRQALRLVGDDGRRPLPRPARLHAGPEGGHLPRRARPAHADRAGVAPRVTPEARLPR